jgi:CheY-like chemotaxis protein
MEAPVKPTVPILVVEDQALVALALEQALEDGGYSVVCAYSGAEALAIIEDRPALLAGLITDIRLGDGPDGWAVARRARQVYPGVPVVYISADSARDHGAEGVPGSLSLHKPFAAAQVVVAISTLINKAAPAVG